MARDETGAYLPCDAFGIEVLRSSGPPAYCSCWLDFGLPDTHACMQRLYVCIIL